MRLIYRARWIIPVSSPPIENGRLEIVDGGIVAVGRGMRPAGGDREVDLGDVVVLPGLVNAHTHLELTLCRGRVPYRGAFVDWVRDLISLTRSGGAGDAAAAIKEGVRQSLAAGVFALADIGHGREAVACWQAAPMSVNGFLEVLGMGPRSTHAHERSLGAAKQILDEAAASGKKGSGTFRRNGPTGAAHKRFLTPFSSAAVRLGLSPHAAYSTAPSIYREAIEFCCRTGRPICAHLAETREEWQFLADGTGPFRELLEEWGLWDGTFEPPGCSPVAYAHRLGLLGCRPLLAHVNYASDGDLDLLAASGASVVYCPRTHRFFEHEPHRYRDMLARGINVCLGTDSLAGNDSLSVLAELQCLRRLDRWLDDGRLLAMGTSAGAQALRLDDRLGSLEPGKEGRFVIVPLDHAATREPLADALTGLRPPQTSEGIGPS